MQKLLHRFLIVSIFIFSFAIMPSVAFSQDEIQTPVQNVQNEVAVEVEQTDVVENNIDTLNDEMGLGEQKAIVIDDINATPNDNQSLTKKIVPDTMTELKKMVKMFLKVMFGVAVSTIIIFILLLFVRRFYAPQVTLNTLAGDDKQNEGLDTPTNKNDALKTFLDKTKNL